MKTALIILLCVFSTGLLYGQAGGYTNLVVTMTTHDPSLDAINANEANVDSDINGYLSQELTVEKLSNNAFANLDDISDLINTNLTQDYSTNAFTLSQAISGWVLTNGQSFFATNGYFTNNPNGTNSIFNSDAGVNSNVGNCSITLPQFSSFSTPTSINLSSSVIRSLSPKLPAYISTVIGGIVWFFLFWQLTAYIQEQVEKSMNQQQVKGPTQAVMGTNASALVGLSYAAAVTALITTTLAAVATNSVLQASVQQMPNFFNFFPQMSQYFPTYDTLTLFLPIGNIVGAYVGYYVAKYFVIWPLFTLVRTTMFWLLS